MPVNGGRLGKSEEPMIAIASPEVAVRSALQRATWLTTCCGKCGERGGGGGGECDTSDLPGALQELNECHSPSRVKVPSTEPGEESECERSAVQSPGLARSKPSRGSNNDTQSSQPSLSSMRNLGTVQVHPEEATDSTDPPLASLEPSQLVTVRISKL